MKLKINIKENFLKAIRYVRDGFHQQKTAGVPYICRLPDYYYFTTFIFDPPENVTAGQYNIVALQLERCIKLRPDKTF